jgi:hypothetical protein
LGGTISKGIVSNIKEESIGRELRNVCWIWLSGDHC